MNTFMTNTAYALLLFLCLAACDRKYDSPLDDGRVNSGKNDGKPKYYMEQYDPISDQGQYWHPDMMKRLPSMHYELYATWLDNRNDPAVPGGEVNAGGGFGLQYHLLCQSLSALNDRAVSNGQLYCGMWMDAGNNINAYRQARQYLKMAGPSFIVWAGNMLTNPGFLPLDGGVMDVIGRNYVLTDVKNNPESSVVAIVASHVHEALIVDVRDQAFFDSNGYTMVYDARQKTTMDSWREFKDQCNNRGLVVIPPQTGELADFAIANGLFAINLNKIKGTSAGGQNTELLREVLSWLQPNSPVYGWETGVGEDEFVKLVSQSGNMMVAIHEFNLPYISHDYKRRQKSILANVINPQDIDYDKDKKFVSYYLSDGPHAGWMMNGFVENYLSDPQVDAVKMSFGATLSNISMIDPLSFERILNQQPRNTTLMESFGGGYFYADDFGSSVNRKDLLRQLADKVASHMRQHRVKVLEQIAHDPTSSAAIEAYQAFVDANDQLEGIIAIQYAPSYAAKGGEIIWVENKQGYKIPVITVSHAIWNHGTQNGERDGTPTHVANQLNQSDDKFSTVIVHAWSKFKDTGDSMDPLAENASGSVQGASAAAMCHRRLDAETFEAINLQELIWRVRMHYEPEQTKKFLTEYY